MIRSYERSISYLETLIEARPKRAGVEPSSWTIGELITELSKCPLPHQVALGDERHLELLEVQVRGRVAFLLFGVTDNRASDPSFRDIVQKKSRVVKKGASEGLTASCHLAIKLDPTEPGVYATLFEQAGVSRGQCVKCLNALLAELPRLHFTSPKKKPSEPAKIVKPALAMRGELAAVFKESLERGTLHNLEFIRDMPRPANAGVTEQFVRDKESARFLMSRDKKWYGQVWGGFTAMLSLAKKEEYSSVRVVFTDSATAKRMTVDVATDADLAEQSVLRYSLEKFQSSLDGAPPNIVEAMVERMCNLMNVAYANALPAAAQPILGLPERAVPTQMDPVASVVRRKH